MKKIAWAASAFFIFSAALAHAAPVWDSQTGNALDQTGTFSFSATAPACTNSVGIFQGFLRADTAYITTSSITYAGSPLTHFASAPGGVDGHGTTWYIFNPTSGSNTFSASWVGTFGVDLLAGHLEFYCNAGTIQNASTTQGSGGGSIFPINVNTSPGDDGIVFGGGRVSNAVVACTNGSTARNTDAFGIPFCEIAVSTTSNTTTVSPSDGGVYNSLVAGELLSGGGGASISWQVPQTGSTSTDFLYWILNAANVATNTDYIFKIDYTTTNSSQAIYEDTRTVNTGNNTFLLFETITKSRPLTSGFPGFNFNWVATATLETASGSALFSTSTQFTVYLGTTTLPALPPPAGTSTLTATCDPNSGFVANSICNVLVFLFYPSPNSLTEFSGLLTTYQNKPPFGYFTAFKNALGGLNMGTSSVVLMSTSSAAAFSGIFNPIRAGLSWLLWFLLAFWAISRFKHLDL